MNNLKNSFAAALVAIGALWAGTANAGDVNWSVGVNLPVPVIVAGGGYYPPVYAPRPVHVVPAYPVGYYRPYNRGHVHYTHPGVRYDRGYGRHDHGHYGHGRGPDRDHDRGHRGHDRGDRGHDRGDRDHGPRGGRH
jgi:hypothetical protein